MQVSIERPSDLSALEHSWLDLEARSDASFFQSWGWVGCWLRALPAGIEPDLVVARNGTEVVGLGVAVRHQRRRRGVIVSNGLYLGETGDPARDNLTIEYNGFLADRRMPEAVIGACLRFFAESVDDCDEFYLSGVGPRYEGAAGDTGLGVRAVQRSGCSYVDLDAIRRRDGDFLAGLSRNTRYQIRRAMRRFEDRGELAFEPARTLEQALEFFSELKEQHLEYWTGRGQPGAFANDFFECFHRALIVARFEEGDIQLLRVSAGDTRIGCLYNFVGRGHVYNYQSGFTYDADGKLKPGLVSHCLAIEHNLARGAKVYDFMAGDSQYKRSLASDHAELVWLVLQRRRIKYRLEDSLRRCKQRFAGTFVSTQR